MEPLDNKNSKLNEEEKKDDDNQFGFIEGVNQTPSNYGEQILATEALNKSVSNQVDDTVIRTKSINDTF